MIIKHFVPLCYQISKMMAKKKSISHDDIITFYMDYVLEHNQQPKSVYTFAKHNNFEEFKFYEFFANF